MKCILLVRVSTEQQSFDEQERELYSLALNCGYTDKTITLVAYKESAIKLSEEERAGLNEMKQLIETGKYDRVFAWEISRIARKKKVLFSILEYLQTRKIQLTIKEPSLDLLNPDGSINEGAETVFTLYAQLAESEMRNKIARFKRGHQEGYDKGKYMGGKITLGYKVNDKGYWEIDEEGANIIRTIFSLYNSGEYSMTELGREMQSRGFLPNVKLTTVKARIHQIIRRDLYIGKRTSNNIYPQLIDQETWDKCVERRKANRHINKGTKYLLTPLIRCKCGASYSVDVVGGAYTCRIKHNAVEKGLQHSPDIHASLIESLAWWLALQEFQMDMADKQEDAMRINNEKIDVLKEKIAHSEKVISNTLDRRSQLDEEYYVSGRFDKAHYERLTEKQNDTIKKEKENIRNYKKSIAELEDQIHSAKTFDELLDSMTESNESLKNGTDIDTMRSIVRRYIKQIYVYPIEGKKTSWWKRVKIETIYDEQNERNRKELEKKGLNNVAITLSTNFTVDCYHHIVYFDEDCKYKVPYTFIDRVPRRRKENRRNRKRKKTQQKQYE